MEGGNGYWNRDNNRKGRPVWVEREREQVKGGYGVSGADSG